MISGSANNQKIRIEITDLKSLAKYLSLEKSFHEKFLHPFSIPLIDIKYRMR